MERIDLVKYERTIKLKMYDNSFNIPTSQYDDFIQDKITNIIIKFKKNGPVGLYI